jgi:ABC-type sugar transport system ATPase subunit
VRLPLERPGDRGCGDANNQDLGDALEVDEIGWHAVSLWQPSILGEGPSSHSTQFKLSPEKAQTAWPFVRKQVIFGTRPEDIHDREFTPPGIRAEPMTSQVDVTELMGNEIFVCLVIGQKLFIARFDPRTSARIGKEMDVVVNLDNSHLFDRDTEEAIR